MLEPLSGANSVDFVDSEVVDFDTQVSSKQLCHRAIGTTYHCCGLTANERIHGRPRRRYGCIPLSNLRSREEEAWGGGGCRGMIRVHAGTRKRTRKI